MADNGELYKIFPDNFPQGMKKLCSKADVILPNITEACLMTGIEYIPGPYSKEWIHDLLMELGKLGAKKVVLTGVYFNEKDLGAAAYDVETDEIEYSFHEIIPGYYHGTGDVFGSAVVAHRNGLSIEGRHILPSLHCESIMRTKEAGTDIRFGVNFEMGIPKLLKQMGL